MGDYGHINQYWARGVGIKYVVNCWEFDREEDQEAGTASDTDVASHHPGVEATDYSYGLFEDALVSGRTR
jgi:hypothetical protein